MKITTDLNYAQVDEQDVLALDEKIKKLHAILHAHDGTDNKWTELPNITDEQELQRIWAAADKIRSNSDVLLVVGVGGSYAGAYAGIQLLANDTGIPVEFLGTSFDSGVFARFFNKYKNKRIAVNIISKSGTTLETIAAFNIVENFMRNKYSENEFKQRMIITTSNNTAFLAEYARINHLTTFNIPDGVVSRYSVLSAVGLLPLAAAGIDIRRIMEGAKQACLDLSAEELSKNQAYRYAAARFLIHTTLKKDVEVQTSFSELMEGFGRWWQQLFGESEGKNGKGLFVSHMVFSRDLHSMGQYIQEGKPLVFETVINELNTTADINFSSNSMVKIPATFMSELNRAAFMGTVNAHSNAGVPIVIINIDRLNAKGFGYLVYFMEIACAMSAYLLGVNPFNQPGVEFYKEEMNKALK
ncbi:MAG: glucose-6-phosphate isomerase [Firmicutes bacterium]|nr:glucose-6-phosphate isomerase [Bacillota bacterium]